MRQGILVKISLFISSYLFLIVALLIMDSNSNILWICLGLVCISIGIVLLSFSRKINGKNYKIKSIQDKNEQAVAYLMTYIIPFITIGDSNVKEVLATVIVLIIIAIIYIKLDLIYVNPIVLILGYYIYEIELENGTKRTLISNKRLRSYNINDKIYAYELEDREILIQEIVRE
jgi:hypothetical protein